MPPLLQDLGRALKLFTRSPGFAAIAVVALMLGIGANTAIFSVVNAVLLKPVPFPEPDRLVMLMISANGTPVIPAASPAQFVYWRARADVLEDVAAFRSTTLNYSGGESPARINAAQATEAYFRTFRAPLVKGRGFTAEEGLPGGARSTVISYRFWKRLLDADPDIIGKKISLSGEPYTVVGVVGPDFDMREYGDPEIWLPLQIDPNTTDGAYLYQVVARLKPGVTLKQAQERLEASVAAFRERFPGVLGPRAGFSARTLQEALVGRGVRTTLFALLGAVGLVMLIACANVANLTLVRANLRQREIAVRSALGASPGRIVRQILAESLLLSLAAGTLGLIFGFLGMRALLAVDTAGLPRLGEAGSLVGMDWRVVSFTLTLSFSTVLLFGLAPALAASRTSLAGLIKGGGSRGSVRQSRSRSALVIVEVALALVLRIGAGLLIRTSAALNRVDPGFDAKHVLTMQTSLSGRRFVSARSVEQTVRIARERLRAIPGVAGAAATCCVPMQTGWGMPFNIPGRAGAGRYTGSNAAVFTSPGYFDVFEIPVLRGRAFNDGDAAAAPPVAIINEAFAKRYWPDGADPLGDRILIGGGAANMHEYAGEPLRRIVGVVGDVRAAGLADEPEPIMYVPEAQLPDALSALVVSSLPTTWVVRTRGNPESVSRAVQEALRRATGLPVTDVRTMRAIVSLSVSRQRLYRLLMSVFAGSALLLAAIGIFGLMAYAVQQRTREIGIRLALGAAPVHLRGTVIRQGMLLVGGGIAAGLAAAYCLASVLASLLFGVRAHDPIVFVAIPIVLTVVALAAMAVPAVRASRVDPLESLRQE
ncbi:MAG TPA: ABC transporter permease [Gammaproteobacteria bacterium]|nr:ABC transporter permease [Gammaproteobacteria bacterium]